MRPTIQSLNRILFEQIERINNDELKGDELKEQVVKSKTIRELASTLLDSAELSIKAREFAADMGLDYVAVIDCDERLETHDQKMRRLGWSDGQGAKRIHIPQAGDGMGKPGRVYGRLQED